MKNKELLKFLGVIPSVICFIVYLCTRTTPSFILGIVLFVLYLILITIDLIFNRAKKKNEVKNINKSKIKDL